jgi:V/A-type H+-transporting ATPase subunit D
MARVNPTRMQLLALKGQIGTAAEGARLLKGKRDALMREFQSAVDTVIESRHELTDLCRAGMNTVNAAKALEGEFCLESAAMGTRRSLPLEVRDKRIWGVAVPEIELRDIVRAFDARGYNPATTPVIVEETAAAFEKILNQALVMAIQETRLRRLGEEIRKTSSRVNALEQILIPGLRSDVAGILAVLEERSREETFRLKRLKHKPRGAEA